jgi:hypothetical protein
VRDWKEREGKGERICCIRPVGRQIDRSQDQSRRSIKFRILLECDFESKYRSESAKRQNWLAINSHTKLISDLYFVDAVGAESECCSSLLSAYARCCALRRFRLYLMHNCAAALQQIET